MILYYSTKFHFIIINSFRVIGCGHFPPPNPPPPPKVEPLSKSPGGIGLRCSGELRNLPLQSQQRPVLVVLNKGCGIILKKALTASSIHAISISSATSKVRGMMRKRKEMWEGKRARDIMLFMSYHVCYIT